MATPGPVGRRRRTPGERMWWHLYRALTPECVGYIGITNDIEARFWEHYADKAWPREIVAWPVDMMERYPSREAAERAERAAILREMPLFNIEHNWNNPRRINPHTMRYASGPYRGMPYRPELYADVHAGRWSPSGRPPELSVGRRPATRRTASPRRRSGAVRRRSRRAVDKPLKPSGWLVTWVVVTGTLLVTVDGIPPVYAGVSGAAIIAALRWIMRKVR